MDVRGRTQPEPPLRRRPVQRDLRAPGAHLRALELYAGIGGFATAFPALPVVRAFDQNRAALATYRRNHPHPVDARNLIGVPARELGSLGADLWWLSPPCQPYTQRGAQRGAEDPRARSFVHVLACLADVRPAYVALENVPAFRGSEAWHRLHEVAARAGYPVEEGVVCPTALGWPNRRARYYFVAGRPTLGSVPVSPPTLPELVEPWRDDLAWDPGAYEHAVHVLDAGSPGVTTCFTAAYGRSPVRAGSYLRQEGRIRRFSPIEVAKLLGFPADWQMEGAPLVRWGHLGNSLSLPVVRAVLGGPGWSARLGAGAA